MNEQILKHKTCFLYLSNSYYDSKIICFTLIHLLDWEIYNGRILLHKEHVLGKSLCPKTSRNKINVLHDIWHTQVQITNIFINKIQIKNTISSRRKVDNYNIIYLQTFFPLYPESNSGSIKLGVFGVFLYFWWLSVTKHTKKH